ncbi:MAG: hypothetical protein AB7E32_13020 [Desulfovibrio sp.]
MKLIYWIFKKVMRRLTDKTNAVNLEILKQFAAHGLDMAFPTQTLQHLPIEVISSK